MIQVSYMYLILCALLSCCALAAAEAPKDLLSNGTFELDADKDGRPDGWSLPAGAAWLEEKGNHFLRLTGAGTSTQVSVFREVPIEGAKAVRVAFRVRHADVKRGGQPWHDARIVMEARDAGKQTIKGALPHPFFTGTSAGWVEKAITRTLPEGTVAITIMPALFMVESGSFDIDDFSITPIDPKTVKP